MRACSGAFVAIAFSALAGGGLAAEAPAPGAAKLAIDLSHAYARLLFSFAKPTPVNASVADGVLTVRTATPLGLAADALSARLSAYVSSGRVDPDGLTYRFALKIPVALHLSTQGDETAVDLVPGGFAGVPPDLAPPPPPPKKPPLDAAKLPAVKVRVGEHADFTRLVFDWATNVPYTAYPGEGRISLRFDALAKPDFSMLDRRSPPWVKSAGWHIEGNSTVIDFETDPGSSFREFRTGTHVVVEVLAPKTDASAFAKPEPGKAAAARPAKADAKAPGAITADAETEAKSSPAPQAHEMSAPAAAPSLAPSSELTRDGAVLHFPAARGHAIAVFRRGEALWIVIDGQPPVDAASLLAPLTGQIVKADAEEDSDALVLRLRLKSPLLASVTQSDVALDVALASAASTPEPVAFTRQGADGAPTLVAELPGAAQPIALTDPDAGDRLLVVPARPGTGTLTPKRFVELEALPTAAGLAIVPRTEDLAASVQDGAVTFSRPQGLALSAVSGAAPKPVVQLPTGKQGPAYIDFAGWAGSGKDVYEAERALRATAARLSESEANKGRLNLARFLIAHRLAPEALGEVEVIQQSDAKLGNDPALNAIAGAADFMMGRYPDARKVLSTEDFAGDPHAALWRGLAETGSGDWADARRDLAAAQSVLRFYPDAWQARVGLARAETGLAQGDLASADDALDQLPPDLSERETLEARLYAAELLAAQGHTNEAVAKLVRLETADDPALAVKAGFARVTTELAAKKIASAKAIDQLEQLRYRWRGDDLELAILRKLGSLYFADQRWREGFGVLRTAAVYFPDSDLARQAQDDMHRAFVALFLDGKADSMPPIQALALYYDFIELTPIGRDGDEMIRKLSDRLVSVDLLGPAEQLLDYQVKKRLDGVARAVVAAKLATIYLLDHKAKEALAAIDSTRESRLPDAINAERRLLEARALAGLKQYDRAVDLIADDDTQEAKRLRADIAWDSHDWKVAGAKAEEALGDRWNVTGALSDSERQQVMRAAVAYALGGDQDSLERLHDRYAAKMNASPDAQSFAVVTDRVDRQGLAFRDLVKKIASVNTLEAFMADFKKRGLATRTASN
jgi:hypothetical protein